MEPLQRNSLREVIYEVGKKLASDDWFQMRSSDGKHSYYVIGREAHDLDVQDRQRFDTVSVPTRVPIGPLGNFVATSQLAGAHPDYLNEARLQLAREGIPADIIGYLTSEDTELAVLAFAEVLRAIKSNPEHAKALQQYDALMHLLEAYRVDMCRQGTPISIGVDEELEIDAVREKRCLEKLVGRYSKIVDRWEQLDQLTFANPVVAEATEAYLYGFYRAAVILCAAALEDRLKAETGQQRLDGYRSLVRSAGLSSVQQAQADSIFDLRNEVVHENRAPTADEAKQALVNVRSVLSHVPSR